jgi:hypothetical protein
MRYRFKYPDHSGRKVVSPQRRHSLFTTRQGEKLIELRDDAKYYSSAHGFSVQSLIKKSWVAR